MKKNEKISLILNILVIVLGIIGLVINFKTSGFNLFEYYTQDSNIIAILATTLYVIFLLKNKKIPNSIKKFKYLAVTSLMLTFLVVIFVLMPMMKEVGPLNLLFKDSMLYHHTLCPIISFISFVFFERNTYTKKDTLYAITFTLIYGIITTILNILGVMKGPYPFLYVYEQPIYMSILWFIIIIGGSYLIALLLRIMCKKGKNEK